MIQDRPQRVNVLRSQRPAARGEDVADDNISAGQPNIGLDSRTSGAQGRVQGEALVVVVVAVAVRRLDAVQRIQGPWVQGRTGSLVHALRIQCSAGKQFVDRILLGRHRVSKRVVGDAVVAHLPRTTLGIVVIRSGALSTIRTKRQKISLAARRCLHCQPAASLTSKERN